MACPQLNARTRTMCPPVNASAQTVCPHQGSCRDDMSHTVPVFPPTWELLPPVSQPGGMPGGEAGGTR